jgi:peroxiredoxin Q/BCP
MTSLNIKPGDTMPDFSLPAQLPDGSTTTITSAGLRGAPYVLFFYPEADTPGCTRESIRFTELAPQFALHAAPVLGISADDLPKQYDFICKYKLSMPLLSDADGALRTQLGNPDGSGAGSEAPPVARITYVVDATGIVKATIGVPRIEAEEHPQAALDTLATL